jgi:DNA-binding NarL/FixJ family response regulator
LEGDLATLPLAISARRAPCDQNDYVLEALRAAVVAMDRARRPGRPHADDALAAWQALTQGRWSLLDRFEEGGRRYLIAHRNVPAADGPDAFTPPERLVAQYASLGHSNKLIAHELGLSIGTVARHLRRASAKLGARSRVDLVRKLSGEPR